MPRTVHAQVDGQVLALSNLDKVLYPDAGFTKAEVIDYYTRVSGALLPHLAGRPVTRKRWPNGVESPPFFEKNAPRGTPSWVRVETLPTPGSSRGLDELDFVIVERLATLVWLANLAALELHVPQWTVGPRGGVHEPDRLVFDLDPGQPATVVDCARVALLVRERLAADGLESWPKTSGSKGLHLYVPLAETSGERIKAYAKAVAADLARENPRLVVARMTKSLRTGKVFVDWDQNSPSKTTVAPYSLRGRARPTVAAPVTWEEVERCRKPEDLAYETAEVLDRLERFGDLLAPLLETAQELPEGVPEE